VLRLRHPSQTDHDQARTTTLTRSRRCQSIGLCQRRSGRSRSNKGEPNPERFPPLRPQLILSGQLETNLTILPLRTSNILIAKPNRERIAKRSVGFEGNKDFSSLARSGHVLSSPCSENRGRGEAHAGKPSHTQSVDWHPSGQPTKALQHNCQFLL
jgi:hypothetical protein